MKEEEGAQHDCTFQLIVLDSEDFQDSCTVCALRSVCIYKAICAAGGKATNEMQETEVGIISSAVENHRTNYYDPGPVGWSSSDIISLTCDTSGETHLHVRFCLCIILCYVCA